jgi:hypothetical protein
MGREMWWERIFPVPINPVSQGTIARQGWKWQNPAFASEPRNTLQQSREIGRHRPAFDLLKLRDTHTLAVLANKVDEWSIKPELTSTYARQSVVFPPSGDSGYLSIQLGRTLNHDLAPHYVRLHPLRYSR